VTQFVLVPGTWLGGWVWRKVRVRLEAAGHSVTTPTLTGLGERSHLASPSIGLETHVTDVVNTIDREGLDDIVLVGHSYGATVATIVADRMPDRVARLVLIGASPVEDGSSMFDVAGTQFRTVVETAARTRGDGWRWPIPEPDELGRYFFVEDMTEADRRWLWANAEPHPVRTLAQPVSLSGASATIPGTWVRCLADESAAAPIPELPDGWAIRSVRSGHWPMVTRPDDLTGILREAAEMACPLPQSMAMIR
jgi:pimeloyl-ACP methyl ester carboxylesterase